MHIHLNSGYIYSIVFTDKDFMNEVLDTFAKIFEDGHGNVFIDTVNQNINYGVQGTGVYGVQH